MMMRPERETDLRSACTGAKVLVYELTAELTAELTLASVTAH